MLLYMDPTSDPTEYRICSVHAAVSETDTWSLFCKVDLSVPEAITTNLIAMASNLEAMASMPPPTSDDLRPTSFFSWV